MLKKYYYASWIIATIIFIIYAVSIFSLEILPYFTTDRAYTFRPDNFWAWSSGIYRRAMLGELLILVDRNTGYGPEILSGMIYATFLVVAAAVCFLLRRSLTIPELILLSLTHFVIFYFVDAEIFLFLPMAAILMPRFQGQQAVVLLLIVVATVIRELAILLYSPVLLYFIQRGTKWIRIGVVLYLIAFVATIMMPGSPNFSAEKLYWEPRGITGLIDEHLYLFVDMSLIEVLARHLNRISNNLLFGGGLWLLNAVFLIVYISHKTRSGILAAWFFGVYVVSSLLSIDHGRYAFFFLAFSVFITTERGHSWFNFEDLNKRLPRLIMDVLDRPTCWIADRRRFILPIVLSLLVVAPSGGWVGGVDWPPRIYVYIEKAQEKLSYLQR